MDRGSAGQDFAGTARRLAAAARARGLESPGFRTPPRQAGYNRTIRRYPDGTALVAVRVKGRLWDDVVDDLIAGVLTVNDLHGAPAAEVRLALWSDLSHGLGRSTSAA
ncbi:MAG: hypothetical protein M3163_00200 [Actinomycetota bacterium]|nr:hypothetical protein [Actinomycetota bacterium]